MSTADTEVQVVKGRSIAEIEARAYSLLRKVAPERLQTPGPTPIVSIFEDHLPDMFGFANLVGELPDSLEGVTNVHERECVISSNVHAFAEIGDGRSRFSIAHEVGHVDLHQNELGTQLFQLIAQGKVLLRKRREVKAYEDPEWQADEYAGCLLMPREMVFRALQGVSGTDQKIRVVTNTFKVSDAAAKKRLRRLGILM